MFNLPKTLLDQTVEYVHSLWNAHQTSGPLEETNKKNGQLCLVSKCLNRMILEGRMHGLNDAEVASLIVPCFKRKFPVSPVNPNKRAKMILILIGCLFLLGLVIPFLFSFCLPCQRMALKQTRILLAKVKEFG